MRKRGSRKEGQGTPVYSYLRVSGKGQEDGQGFDRQRDTISRFCKKSGYTIQGEYKDIHTGTVDGVERPGFADLVRAIDANGSRIVVVERLDRLARTILAQEHTVLWLTAHDIELIVADTGENVSEAYKADDMKKALIQIQGVFSELEKSMIVKKLRHAREKIRKSGKRCEGSKPFGFYPGEKETLNFMRKLRRPVNGKLSYKAIAKNVQDAGHTPRNAETWTAQNVRKILVRSKK